MQAALKGRADACEALLQMGADTHALSEAGRTPLQKAVIGEREAKRDRQTDRQSQRERGAERERERERERELDRE